MPTMLSEPVADQSRRHVAEIFALKVLCVAEINGADVDVAQVAAITATMIAKQTPADLERYAEMPWEEAIGSIAVELWQFYHDKTVCIPNPRCLQQ